MSLARTGSLGYRQHRLTCIPALHLVGMNPRLLARSPPLCGRETVSQSACQCTIADDVGMLRLLQPRVEEVHTERWRDEPLAAAACAALTRRRTGRKPAEAPLVSA